MFDRAQSVPGQRIAQNPGNHQDRGHARKYGHKQAPRLGSDGLLAARNANQYRPAVEKMRSAEQAHMLSPRKMGGTLPESADSFTSRRRSSQAPAPEVPTLKQEPTIRRQDRYIGSASVIRVIKLLVRQSDCSVRSKDEKSLEGFEFPQGKLSELVSQLAINNKRSETDAAEDKSSYCKVRGGQPGANVA